MHIGTLAYKCAHIPKLALKSVTAHQVQASVVGAGSSLK